MPDSSTPLHRLHDAIAALSAQEDLAGVIIHLNDTYQIEARPPSIPGLARIAAAVESVTTWVKQATGEDRTLVVHSGDFLSPSFMTTRLGFAGKQMVDLLNRCGLDYATLGNHEFDVSPDDLKRRLSEAAFGVVCSNMDSPDGFASAPSIVYWPPHEPFLAIAGFVGQQTIEKATRPKFRYRQKNLHDVVIQTFDQVRMKPEIGAIVLLTHMDRNEDKKLQTLIDKKWPKEAMAFVLGGHDHDISWQEQGNRTVLCKNLSNCRTLTAIVLSKSAVAAPHSVPRRPRPLRQEQRVKEAMKSWENLSIPWNSNSLPAGADSYERIVEHALTAWNNLKPQNSRADFNKAYETRLRETWTEMDRGSVEREDFLGIGGEHLFFESATWQAVSHYQLGHLGAGILSLDGNADLSGIDPDKTAEVSVEGWVKKMEEQIGLQGREVIIDYSANSLLDKGMNAQDDALRTSSTDFGNFVADAAKQGMGVDFAMINAGSFRLDDFIGPVITRRDLHEVFLYDHEKAVVVVELTADDIQKMLDHARQKSGQGAFLQISRGLENLLTQVGPIRTALVRHMLFDNEDGYQSLIAQLRGCEPAEIEILIAAPERSESLLGLIARGAREVEYSAENRLAGSKTSGDNSVLQFVARIDQYVRACSECKLTDGQALRLLEWDPTRHRLEEQVSRARLVVRLVVLKLAMDRGFEWLQENFWRTLDQSDLNHRRRRSYHNFLDKAMTYFEMNYAVPVLKDEKNFPKLKDEEGQPPLTWLDEDAISFSLTSEAGDPHEKIGTRILEFADLTDVYRIICRQQGLSDDECLSFLVARPNRNLPPEAIRAARMQMRSALIGPIVAWGLERARRDLCDGMTKLDHDTPHVPPCIKHLEATFSYFNLLIPYGLLRDEERR